MIDLHLFGTHRYLSRIDEFGDQNSFMSTSRETLELTPANQAYEFGLSRRSDLN
jgi:hypothetical protein